MTTLLERPAYACLNGAPTVRYLTGCTARCAACYQRGHEQIDPPSQAEPIENAIERITWALGQQPRSAPPITHVMIDPDADAFPNEPRAQDTAYRLFRTLLERRIGLSFFTRGTLTRRFVDLFATNRGRIRGHVGWITSQSTLAALFEAGAATPMDRLDTIAALTELEALADVRIDPIIPGLTDTESVVTEMLDTLHQARVKRVVLSYVHLRPAIHELLARVVPSETKRLIEETYRTQPWMPSGTPTEVKLLPRAYREEGYLRFRQAAERVGIQVGVCQCKNPDMSGDSCGTVEAKLTPVEARRGVLPTARPTLFPC